MSDESPKVDRVLIGPPVESGAHAVLRFREDSNGDRVVAAGVIQPLQDGKPVTHGEIVQLSPVGEGPLYNAKTVVDLNPKGQALKGNFKAYASGWDRIWGSHLSKDVN